MAVLIPAGLVVLDARARAAWPWLPPALPVAAVAVGPDGEAVRVEAGGAVRSVAGVVPGRRGAAGEPCAGSGGDHANSKHQA